MIPLPSLFDARPAHACAPRWSSCAGAFFPLALALTLALVLGTSLARADGGGIEGITEAYLDVTLSPPVAGILGRHFFKEGDTVEAGQVIVELDKRIEELEVARREAALNNVANVLKRTEELAARTRSVSPEELEKQRAEQRIAQAELDLAREQLRRRQVAAPFSGVVADLFNLEDGEACQPQTPIVRLVDTRQCWLVANVEARQAQALKVGSTVTLRIETDRGPRDIPAEIRFVSPVADPASGLVRVKALFDNSSMRIPAGIAASLQLPPAETPADK